MEFCYEYRRGHNVWHDEPKMRCTLRYTLRQMRYTFWELAVQETLAASEEVTQLLRKCKKIVTAMDVLDEEMTMDNFNLHFYGEEVMQKKEEELRVGQVRPRLGEG